MKGSHIKLTAAINAGLKITRNEQNYGAKPMNCFPFAFLRGAPAHQPLLALHLAVSQPQD